MRIFANLQGIFAFLLQGIWDIWYPPIQASLLAPVSPILSQSSNATREWPEIYTTNCLRTVYFGKEDSLSHRKYVVWSMFLWAVVRLVKNALWVSG